MGTRKWTSGAGVGLRAWSAAVGVTSIAALLIAIGMATNAGGTNGPPSTITDLPELSDSYDHCVVAFKVFWRDWLPEVLVPLVSGESRFREARTAAQRYRRAASTCAATWDAFNPSPDAQAAVDQGRKAFHQLADGASAAEAAGVASDAAGLEIAASLLTGGAAALEALRVLVQASP